MVTGTSALLPADEREKSFPTFPASSDHIQIPGPTRSPPGAGALGGPTAWRPISEQRGTNRQQAPINTRLIVPAGGPRPPPAAEDRKTRGGERYSSSVLLEINTLPVSQSCVRGEAGAGQAAS